MNTFIKILRRSRSSVPSGTRLTNAKVGNLICGAVLAGLLLSGGSAKATFSPYNVLINPGAETGDFTGWQQSLTGYKYVVSTNGTIPNSGGSNFLAHSGQYTFQLFDTTADSAYIYQDFAAIAGSQWSANCWAICYASNYFSSGANAHLQVVFYDASNNVVPYYPPTGQMGGVYGSDFLDPVDNSGYGIYWTIVPPMAVDASGWLFLQPTNLYFTDPATEGGYDSSAVLLPTTLTAPTNTAKVRFQIEFDNSATGGGDVYWDDCNLTKQNQTDPDITNAPVAVTTYAGLSASFSVVATHTSAYPGEKLHYQWEYNGTSLPANGGVNDIAGTTTTSILSFTNLQGADSGQYDVVVTVVSTAGNYTNSIRSVPVPLTVLVLSPLQKANVLGPNAGFENGSFGSWDPWEIFNGCYFASTNSVYGTSTTPVNVFDGNWCALVGGNGDRDNGFHHAFGHGANCTPVAGVTPGSLWKAGGWAYISSSNDFVAGNTCRLQIWFKDINGNDLTPSGTPTFESFKIYGLAYTNSNMQYTNVDLSSPYYGQVGYHAQLPRDQWCYLPVTNVVDNGGIGLADDLPIGTWNAGYFIVPNNPSIAQINFQVYEYCPITTDTNADGTPGYAGGYLGSASDAVYWDDMELIQVVPVTDLKATSSASGNQFNLTFSAGAGLNYTVLYKNNLSDPTWNALTTVAAPLSWQTNPASVGTTYPITVTDSLAQHSRFYRIQSQ